MVRAHGSSEAETRREEELMLFHHDDEQQSIRPHLRPKGYGGVTPSALLPDISPDPHIGRLLRLASGATPP